jgi:hypothetical protein
MDKKELSSLIREEIKSVLKEGDFELSQGYGSDYYKTSSDILETWTSMKTVEDDLMKFMEAAAQTQGAGPKFATAIAGLLAKVASKGMAKYKNAGPVYESKKGLNENADLGFKPTKKQQEIIDLIHEMTEHKKAGLIKYMFSVIGDDLNMAYYHWSDDTWKKAEKFFEAYEEAMETKEVKEADMKMKEIKMKKK